MSKQIRVFQSDADNDDCDHLNSCFLFVAGLRKRNNRFISLITRRSSIELFNRRSRLMVTRTGAQIPAQLEFWPTTVRYGRDAWLTPATSTRTHSLKGNRE